MISILVLKLVLSSFVFAHPGHSHGPAVTEPPKGGILKTLESVQLELVTLGQEMRIYAYDSSFNSVKVAQFPASAVAGEKGSESKK